MCFYFVSKSFLIRLHIWVISYDICLSLYDLLKCLVFLSSMETVGFPGGTRGKEPACQCRRHKRHRFDPWLRKIQGNLPLQYSCLGNSMDREAWQATVHRVAKSWMQLKWLSLHTHMQLPIKGGFIFSSFWCICLYGEYSNSDLHDLYNLI